MELSESPAAAGEGRWTSLWVVALLSLLAQLWLCQFFSFGERVPVSLDVNPSNLWKFAYHYPPTGSFQVLNWLGLPYAAQPLNPLSLAANSSAWIFFTCYVPVISTCALLAMAAFLRELELSRPAALFGGVIYAWQGDVLPFIYPGHYGYLTSWPFFALAAWGALRASRTRHWAYPVVSGASCGLMIGLLTNADRGAIASLLVIALYLGSIFRCAKDPTSEGAFIGLGHLALFFAVTAVVALAPLLSLFQSNIVGVKLAGAVDREQTFKLVTQFSLGPAETLTYLVPGFFGWHINHAGGPYWGWIGEWPNWPNHHEGTRNLNLAISTTGTIATVLALIGACSLLPGALLGSARTNARQRFYGRILLSLGLLALILSWGWHTPFYRPLFVLPLMDKWRNPLKWLEMTNFALVVLGSMGVQHVFASLGADTAESRVMRRRLIGFVYGWLVLLALGLVASYPLAIVLEARLQADGYDAPTIANMVGTMHTSLFGALVLTAFLCLLFHAVWQPDRLRTWNLVNPWLHRVWQRALQPEVLPLTLSLALAMPAALQLGWVAEQFIQPAPLDELTATNPLLETLRSEGDTVRVSVATDDPVLDDLLQNQFAAMKISSLDISAASRIPDDLNTFFQALNHDQARLWLLAGVKNVAVSEPTLAQLRLDPGVAANIDHADGYTLEQTASPDVPSHALVGLKDYLAKATLVPRAEFYTSDETLLKRLADSAWNPRESILVDPGFKLPFLGPAEGSPDHVELKTYTPTKIEIDVQSARGGYVLVNDQYDPDWRAQVNGREVPLLRADYILRAVQVPPGDSTVTMRYLAHDRIGGLKLPAVVVNNFSDGAMLAAWLVAGLMLWRKESVATRSPAAS